MSLQFDVRHPYTDVLLTRMANGVGNAVKNGSSFYCAHTHKSNKKKNEERMRVSRVKESKTRLR